MFVARHRCWRASVGLLAALVLVGGCLQTGEPVDQTPGSDEEPETTTANSAPLADAGADQTAKAGELVVLDGTDSTDADGDRLAFIWRQVGGQPEVVLADGFSSRPRFFAPTDIVEKTVLTFRLTVVDGLAVDFDEVTVTIEP